MRVRLYSLLEGSHLLDFVDLATPLLVNGPALVSLQPKLLGQAFLLLLHILDLFRQLFDFFVCFFTLFTLESIDSLEEAVGVLNFVLDEGPKLLEKGAQVLRFLLGLLELLIKEFFAVS